MTEFEIRYSLRNKITGEFSPSFVDLHESTKGDVWIFDDQWEWVGVLKRI